MARVSLKERIKRDLFLLDGAMGTELIARGVEVGKCNDFLNIEQPDVISDIHRSYFEAGSDAVITNTFGANKYALGRHGFAEEVIKINKAGAQIARGAAVEEKPPGEVVALAGERQAARRRKDFKAADAARDRIRALGWAVEDTKDGMKFRRA